MGLQKSSPASRNRGCGSWNPACALPAALGELLGGRAERAGAGRLRTVGESAELPRPLGSSLRGLMKGTPSEQCPLPTRVEGPEPEESREEESGAPGSLAEGLGDHLGEQNAHLHPRVQLLQTKNLLLLCNLRFGTVF